MIRRIATRYCLEASIKPCTQSRINRKGKNMKFYGMDKDSEAIELDGNLTLKEVHDMGVIQVFTDIDKPIISNEGEAVEEFNNYVKKIFA